MNDTNDFILETAGLTREFRGLVAVKGVSLKVRRGTIHALIGPDGAGKTTCFNLLTKFLTLTSGRSFYRGQEITGAAPAGLAGSTKAIVFQLASLTDVHWTISGEVVLMTLPGAARRLVHRDPGGDLHRLRSSLPSGDRRRDRAPREEASTGSVKGHRRGDASLERTSWTGALAS